MENKKINFFKKFWYSIAKPSKYQEMREEKVGASIKYIFTLIALLALILAIIATIIQMSVVKDAISYLYNSLPEIKFKDNKLSLENNEAKILDEDKVKDYFGSTIVINPLLEEEKAIEEYKNLSNEKYSTIVFLSDEYIIITNKYNPESDSKDGVFVHKYSDESSKYIKDSSIEYNKESIISYLREQTSYTYYIAQYFSFYFIMIAILYIVYIAFISFSLWLLTKIAKIKWTFKESLMNTIYASTLSMLIYVIYMVINYFTKFSINFMDIVSIFLIFVYIFILIYKGRNVKEESDK